MLIASAGLFGIFLFLTYYLQQTLGYSPLVTGAAFLPISSRPHPRVQSVYDRAHAPDRAQAAGRSRDAGRRGRGGVASPVGPAHRLCRGCARPDHPGRNRRRPGDRAGDQRHLRRGPADAGVASATVTVGQQLGASVGTSLLNTIFTAAVTSYLAVHLAAARLIGEPALDWAGAGARLRHRLLGEDRRHLRHQRGHRRRPAPAPGHCARRARRPQHTPKRQLHKPRPTPLFPGDVAGADSSVSAKEVTDKDVLRGRSRQREWSKRPHSDSTFS